MRIADVAKVLEQIAPPAYAEPWDNVGLLVGDPGRPCSRVLLCVDLTPAVLAEAVAAKAKLVMAYHPVIFKPIARVTAETMAYRAVRAGVGVYSIHTAYDSAIGGANDALADALGMGADRRPLEPRCAEGQYKVVTFVPAEDLPAVSAAAFGAGAGQIGGYRECGFAAEGTGSFRGDATTHPTIGRAGRREQAAELRWETVCPAERLPDVLAAIRAAHRYETPAIDAYRLTDAPPAVGLGRVGRLARPVGREAMFGRIRAACGVRRFQVAAPPRPGKRRKVRTLAVGCGSCGSLFRRAVAAGADWYVTGELRHHDALAAAAAGMTVVCVGHSNSERLTLAPLAERLGAALPGLEVTVSAADEDPFITA